ncbi:MAG TPA: DUF6493 family protein [Spirillospora sp.]|nr:DUF6493 family protein [Spirillospora sp.]
MTTTAWDEIAALITAKDAHAVAGAVRGLDAAARRDVAARLPGHVREVRSWQEPWEGVDEFAAAFRVAGAGTLGGASAVAAWLTRREFNSRWMGDHHDTALLMSLWEDRDGAWLADLARRLTVRLRGPRHIGLDLVLALLGETGAEPPEHDPLVVGWVMSAPPRIRDPLLPALLPRIFEAEGVGRVLRDRDSWVRTLATHAKRGDVGREMLLDGCVRRFLRGGTAMDLRFFVRLHDALAPSEAEAGARARDYARLLPAAPGPVAESALDLLKDRDDLPPGLVAEALDGLLFRAESGLVRTGLAWLERTVRRHPDAADGCAAALAQAFGHESYAVQQRAARVALKLPDAVDGTPLRDAVPLLPPDLAAQVAARFGGEVAEPDPSDDDPAPPALAAPDLGRPAPLTWLPQPISAPVELAAAFHHLDEGSPASEQILDALVRLTWKDRSAVREVLGPVMRRRSSQGPGGAWFWRSAWDWLNGIGVLLTGSAPPPPDGRDLLPYGRVSAPCMLFLRRFAEVYGAFEDGTLPPVLLATATRATGHLDSGTFVARLERCEAAGVEPLPADLAHALLRLPRQVDSEVVRRAGRLSSEAGRTAARWLAEGGLPSPGVGVREITEQGPEVMIRAEPTGLPAADEVFTAPSVLQDSIDGWQPLFWSWLLPSHPEVVAAHLAPLMIKGAPVQVVTDLMPGGGPFAEAVAHALAFKLVKPYHKAADASMLSLAARGDLPAAALGRHIARLALAGEIKLVRAVEALQRAADAGAYAQVWDVIAAALPVLHPEPGRRALHAHDRLIALGTRTARWAEASGAPPEIEELAARKGSANLVREAAALAAQLR